MPIKKSFGNSFCVQDLRPKLKVKVRSPMTKTDLNNNKLGFPYTY